MVSEIIIWQAVVTVCTAIWLTFHRVALNRGFLLKRHGTSTDTLFSLVIGLSSSAWTILALIVGSLIDESTSMSFFGRAARGPVLLQILFILWVVTWIDGLQASESNYSRYYLWNLSTTSGSFDWTNSLSPPMFWVLIILLCVVILPTSATSIFCDGNVVQGVMNVIGLLIFLFKGTKNNPYTKAPHRYQGDMLRIILPTSHHEGTVYILPSLNHGFDAVWSPKIENENISADHQAMQLFRSLRSHTTWSLKEPLERIRLIVSEYQERVVLGVQELENLAAWLYLEPDSEIRRMRCSRATETHLIGRDLMYALCHAESLVFMGQGKISPALQAKIGMLRLMKRSGAPHPTSSVPVQCIGYNKSGIEGYTEAVEYIYKLFDEPVDYLALNFDGTEPPQYSYALSKRPQSIEDYVAELWDVSCLHSESTFTTLYMFALVWSIELGNCNGFHLFPLRCRNRNGDLTSQAMVWRQIWYSGIVCQLVSSSPVLFAAFVAGYLG